MCSPVCCGSRGDAVICSPFCCGSRGNAVMFVRTCSWWLLNGLQAKEVLVPDIKTAEDLNLGPIITTAASVVGKSLLHAPHVPSAQAAASPAKERHGSAASPAKERRGSAASAQAAASPAKERAQAAAGPAAATASPGRRRAPSGDAGAE